MADFLEGLVAGQMIRSAIHEHPPVYDGPAPAVNVAVPTAYDAAAWRLLQKRHPRLYKRTMRDVRRVQRLHSYYLGKVG